MQNVLRQACQKCTLWIHRKFLKVTVFCKVGIVWIVSEYERNLMAGWLKLPSKSPVERFDKKLFFGDTSYSRPVRNALYAFTETFWRKQFFWKVTIVWIASEYERKLMPGWIKLPSKCPVERFDEKHFFGESSYFWWGFHTSGKTFLGFYEGKRQDCQNNIPRLRWNMLKRKWFT